MFTIQLWAETKRAVLVCPRGKNALHYTNHKSQTNLRSADDEPARTYSVPKKKRTHTHQLSRGTLALRGGKRVRVSRVQVLEHVESLVVRVANVDVAD